MEDFDANIFDDNDVMDGYQQIIDSDHYTFWTILMHYIMS